ncbi:MAG: type II toxin-antitoxin system HipA family toxin [Magnetococcus sp. DMHC-1]
MNGEHVGRWTVTPQGEHEFEYAESWVASAYGRSISLSMPMSRVGRLYKGAIVENYFDNLLPDNDKIRVRIQQRFGAPSQAPFDLLAEIGRDCVGALQLLPDDETPGNIRQIEAEAVSEADIEQILDNTFNASVFGQHQDEDDFRISIAGVQEKTALLFHEERWLKPRGATPTTHILKFPIGRHGNQGIDLAMSVENEWLCARILNAYGIRVAKCWPATFGRQKVLVVERFDRRLARDGSWIMRLPQEDMCQARGVAPDLKYEKNGGPGVKTIMDLLLGSASAEADRADFFKTQIVYWLICAIDGHAKNFSIFLEPHGTYRLTPRYDVLSAYPVLGNGPGLLQEKKARMAMALIGKNRHDKWAELQKRHFEATARSCGIEASGKMIVEHVLAATPKIIAEVAEGLPGDFPERIAKPILDGLQRMTQRLT